MLEEPLGNARLHGARLMAALLHTNTPSINQELCRLNTMGLLLVSDLCSLQWVGRLGRVQQSGQLDLRIQTRVYPREALVRPQNRCGLCRETHFPDPSQGRPRRSLVKHTGRQRAGLAMGSWRML